MTIGRIQIGLTPTGIEPEASIADPQVIPAASARMAVPAAAANAVATTTPAPVAPLSKLDSILNLINIALQGLTLVPIIGTYAGLSDAFIVILQSGLAAYNAEVGQPLDLNKIHPETLI
jgi:hypothetical protein